jgi:hypothetical protein
MAHEVSPVLLIGGAGMVGSHAVRILRQLHPHLPLAIGGRNQTRADALAAEVGKAGFVSIDLTRADLGLPKAARYSAVAIFLKDDRLNAMRYAQQHGLPFICLSSSTFEIGLEVAQFVHAPRSAPIYLASHWLAGASLMPALLLAQDYQHIDAIHLAVLVDELDLGGPAAHIDYERIIGNAPSTLVLKDGEFTWISGDQAKATVVSVDGVAQEANAYAPFDILSLGAATNARNIRLDLVVGESASRRRGEPFSTEIQITIDGELESGRRARKVLQLVHPVGQAPLTGLGVALAVERLLGLAGPDLVEPGLYMPELLIDPAYYVRRMEEFGAAFTQSEIAG